MDIVKRYPGWSALVVLVVLFIAMPYISHVALMVFGLLTCIGIYTLACIVIASETSFDHEQRVPARVASFLAPFVAVYLIVVVPAVRVYTFETTLLAFSTGALCAIVCDTIGKTVLSPLGALLFNE